MEFLLFIFLLALSISVYRAHQRISELEQLVLHKRSEQASVSPVPRPAPAPTGEAETVQQGAYQQDFPATDILTPVPAPAPIPVPLASDTITAPVTPPAVA